MLILHLLLWPAIIASLPSSPSAAQKAEVAKLRSELEKALEDDGGAPVGKLYLRRFPINRDIRF